VIFNVKYAEVYLILLAETAITLSTNSYLFIYFHIRSYSKKS